MDEFLSHHLHPAETCIICTEPFGTTHHPVSLPCQHIFGAKCIRKWLRKGKGNAGVCPTCRYVVFERKTAQSSFNADSIWKAVYEQPPDRLHALMMEIWSSLQGLWKDQPSGKFSDTDILRQVIIPALKHVARQPSIQRDGTSDPVMDCHNLIVATWNSLGRPNQAGGLAIPFVRLARLMSCASTTLPKWLTTHPRVNRLIWRANSCIGLTERDVKWEFVMEASKLANDRYFPLLHPYTVLVSQSIAHNTQPSTWPERRHEVMNLVVQRCCTKIGGEWPGTPSSQFKDTLVNVHTELSRFQAEKKRMSLRGRDEEQSVVRGLWALARMGVEQRSGVEANTLEEHINGIIGRADGLSGHLQI